MRRFANAVAGLALALTACQTITEEMPTRPNPVGNPIPVVVVPVPLPSPANPAPTPGPDPGPPPAPAPDDDDDGLPPGDWPDNTAPVARLGAKVYFVECDGEIVPGSEHATSARLGCRIHMDCTPKDANNKPTRARGTPRWTYSDSSLIRVSGTSPYNPVLTAVRAGTLSMFAQVDGVRSETITVRLH